MSERIKELEKEIENKDKWFTKRHGTAKNEKWVYEQVDKWFTKRHGTAKNEKWVYEQILFNKLVARLDERKKAEQEFLEKNTNWSIGFREGMKEAHEYFLKMIDEKLKIYTSSNSSVKIVLEELESKIKGEC